MAETEVANVLCMKWGTKYSADFVNTLYSMVSRNMHRAFRFVCLTEDSAGLHQDIEVFPLPKLNVDLAGPERGWNKLAVFAEELYDLKGQVLCLDLDLIITGSLDDFFDYPGDVLIIKDWIKKDGTGNSSVYRFEVGAHAEVLSEFERSFDQIKKTHRNEQEYMSAAMNAKGALAYWPDHWCRSFKRHCIQPLAMFLARETIQPADMRVLVFHGKPDPDDAIAGTSGKWYRRFKPATWVAEHWR
jgi:hypothetical protein